MTNGTNGTTVPSFASLSARITDANKKVERAKDASSIDAGHLAEIKLNTDNFGDVGKLLLKELREAEAAIDQDPLTSYLWKKRQLKDVAELTEVDPDMALRLIALCGARLMPDQKTEIRPILVDFDRFDEALRHAQQVGRNIRPVALPVTSYDEFGRISMSGMRFCVPNGEAERESFEHIRRILKAAGTSAVGILHDECLFDLHLMGDWLVRTLPRAQLASTGKLKDRKFFALADDGRYEERRGKHSSLYLDCPIGRKRHLLLLDSPENRDIMERIAVVKRNNEQLKCDGLNIDVCIIRQMRREDMPVVSPRDFLLGAVGKTAVRCSWDARGSTADVQLLLTRRSDGAWRVLFYNKAAAHLMLSQRNGRELLFTWFSGVEIPGHLAAALRKGTPVTAPADLGLTEEDVAESAPAEDATATESSEPAAAQPAA